MANISELIHGRKPDVAPFIPTDPLEMLKLLLQGEIKDWPQIEQLGNLYQTYMLQSLNEAIPGFTDILKEGGAATQAVLQNAKDLSESKIPQDLQDEVLRHAAFTSLGAGTLGGPMGLALGARDLGLTGLNLMTQGAQLNESGVNAAQRWSGIANGTIMPPPLYSPEWFSQFQAQQNAARQATKQFKFNTAAAPDPAWADRAKILAGILGSYAGGPGGGAAASGAASSTFNQNFGGGQASGPAGGGFGYGQPATNTNPGFFSNFGTAYGGGQAQGVGGWLGSIWPGSQPPSYLSGMPSDVSHPGTSVPVTPVAPFYQPPASSNIPINFDPGGYG